MLIRNAAIAENTIVDVRIDKERISTVAPKLDKAGDETLIDAQGCALIPGLHDHHMHLLALAAALQSVDCNCDRQTLATRLNERRKDKPAEIRGIGYFPDHGLSIDRQWLDTVCPDIPVRIQHQSGRLWILNSLAISQIAACANSFPEGAERNEYGELTGLFYHLDNWLRDQLPRHTPDLATASRKLAACGVTGITDAGPDNDDSVAKLLLQAQARGELLQNVVLMGRADLSAFDEPGLQRGAEKIYLKEIQLPEYDALVQRIQSSHNKNRPVAFHCVTRVELQFALAALKDAGVHPGDRIEHASITSDDALEQMRELQVTVVTQPHFIYERGDRYLDEVDLEDQPLLYRGRAFISAGIPFAGGTDAPYGDYDPWKSMRAAVERLSKSGTPLRSDEHLNSMQALALYTGDAFDPGSKPKQIAAGQKADVCLLDTDWQTMLSDFDSQHVKNVFRSGKLIFQH